MKFACLFIVAVTMASLTMSVPLGTNEHENKPKGNPGNVVAHLRRLIANIEETNMIPVEYIHMNRRKVAAEGNIPIKFSDQPPTETLTDSYPGETSTHNPALTLTNNVGFGTADSYGMACGGAISLGANTEVYGNIITTGAFNTGDHSSVFGDVDCVGSVYLGTNANFYGNLISQSAVFIDAIVTEPQAKFIGNITCMGAIMMGAKTEVIGNINACASFAPGPLSSVTGHVLVGSFSSHVPVAKDTGVLDDITMAFNNLMSTTGGAGLGVSIVAGELIPGIYKQLNTWNLPSGKTLTFNGTSSDRWIIQVHGSVAVFGDVLLKSGALASNIQWVVDGAVSIGTNVKFYGGIVASGTISVGSGAWLHGLLYSPAGSCSLGAGVSLATV